VSWAEVKKINSDMGTPLNKLFEDSITLISDDSHIYHLFETNYYQSNGNEISSQETNRLSFNTEIQGVANLDISLTLNYNMANTYNTFCSIILRKNNVLINSYEQNFPMSQETIRTQNIRIPISISKGDSFDIVIITTHYRGNLNLSLDTNIKALPVFGGKNRIKEV
jgi:hypothetical protein